MKISMKVREERRPIVRAKLPLNVLGLPLFTGVTSGDQEELALHLGTDVSAGPSCRVSYKPNNEFSPFSVLVKAGLGLWGSPNGAAMALSAEFDLNSNGSPSFSVRLKPKFGDFGLRKDSGRFKASYENQVGDKMITMDSLEEHAKSGEDDLVLNDREAEVQTISPNGKGIANGDLHQHDLESTETFMKGPEESSDSFEQPRDTPETETVKSIDDPSPSEDEDLHYEQLAESDRNAVGVSRQADESTSVRGKVNSRLGVAAKGWRFNAHSALPFGSWAVAKVRWQVKFASNIIHDVRQGMHITDIRLPTLGVDKVSFETTNPRRSRRSSDVDLAGLGFEDSPQLSRIAAMCASMRYQIQLLHLENKLLKNTIDEWRSDLPAIRRSGAKGSELTLQEDKMFDELNGKLHGSINGNGKSNANGKSREGRLSGDSQSVSRPNGKGSTSTGEEFSISKDPSEELQKAILNATAGGH